jgi:hypothetical protein
MRKTDYRKIKKTTSKEPGTLGNTGAWFGEYRCVVWGIQVRGLGNTGAWFGEYRCVVWGIQKQEKIVLSALITSHYQTQAAT